MTAPGSSLINFLKLSVITVLQIKEVTHSLVDTSTTYSLQNISKYNLQMHTQKRITKMSNLQYES